MIHHLITNAVLHCVASEGQAVVFAMCQGDITPHPLESWRPLPRFLPLSNPPEMTTDRNDRAGVGERPPNEDTGKAEHVKVSWV